MKVNIALLFLGIIAVASSVNASPPAVNYEGAIEPLINDLQDIPMQTAKLVELQYQRIVVEPFVAVDLAIQKIEDQRAENVDCVAAKDPAVELVVDALHENMYGCGIVAAQESSKLVSDINDAVQQLVFDGYNVLRLYQKCKKYKNSILRKSCYTKLTIQATLYIKNARKSIKTIKAVNQRIPPVFAEADVCTHNSAEEAIDKLDAISTEIDACIKQTF